MKGFNSRIVRFISILLITFTVGVVGVSTATACGPYGPPDHEAEVEFYQSLLTQHHEERFRALVSGPAAWGEWVDTQRYYESMVDHHVRALQAQVAPSTERTASAQDL